jgi:hypothetical protein
MMLILQLLGIWTLGNIAFALQRIYLGQRRERREQQFAFADGPKHPLSETDATNAAPPASRGLVASDKFARLS